MIDDPDGRDEGYIRQRARVHLAPDPRRETWIAGQLVIVTIDGRLSCVVLAVASPSTAR